MFGITSEVEFRRPKHKKRRRRDLKTDKLEVYAQIQDANLNAVLIDAAVWLCIPEDVIRLLDSSCFGNLDGGIGMADHVRSILEQANVHVEGVKAVRLSLDEAFFLHYGLRALTVFESPSSPSDAPKLLDTASFWRKCQRARRDFTILYSCYHHFRSKVHCVLCGWQEHVHIYPCCFAQ